MDALKVMIALVNADGLRFKTFVGVPLPPQREETEDNCFPRLSVGHA